METTIRIGDVDYDTANLSDTGQAQFNALKYVDGRLAELQGLHAALNRAKNAYMADLKQEIVSARGGFILGDD